MNSTVAISIGAVVILAGVAVYAVMKSKQGESQQTIAAYDAGLARGSKRTDAEKVGGSVGSLFNLLT